MKNTTAMADYELRHIEALRKDLAGCTVLLKKDGSSGTPATSRRGKRPTKPF